MSPFKTFAEPTPPGLPPGSFTTKLAQDGNLSPDECGNGQVSGGL
jgi:hypothetical protein